MVRAKVSSEKVVKSRAWKIDANEITKLADEEIAATFASLMPLQTEAVRLFVEADDDETTVLVGPKGSGKTFLLLAKSYYQRRRTSGDSVRFFPTHDLIERIGSGVNLSQIAEANPQLWRSATSWCEAWSIAISAIAVEVAGLRKQLSAQDRERFAAFFPELFHTDEPGKPASREKHKFTFFLRQAMQALSSKQDRANIFDIHHAVIAPALSGHNDPIAFFLDAPDEAIESPDGNTEHTVSSWLQMQLGLLLAIRQIRQVKNNLHVYATLRSEVYRQGDRTAQFQQARAVCLHLTYSKGQLKEIFEKNCEADAAKWFLPTAGYPITAFLGVNRAAHSCVVDQLSLPVEEFSFDRILRHTFYRPRDLMEMGRAISRKQDYTAEQLKQITNKVAGELLSFVQDQSYPIWDAYYLEVLKCFDTNVLSKRLLDQIRHKFQLESPVEKKLCPFNYLYCHGLLGYLSTTGSHRRQQFYIDPTVDHALSAALPTADWYFLHPALNQLMDDHHGQNYHKHGRVICGHEYPVPSMVSLRFELRSDEIVRVEFERRQLFGDKLTMPKGLLMVVARACINRTEQSSDLTALLEAHDELASKGWFPSNAGVRNCVEKFAAGSSDQSKDVNLEFKSMGMKGVLKRVRQGVFFSACRKDQVEFIDSRQSDASTSAFV